MTTSVPRKLSIPKAFGGGGGDEGEGDNKSTTSPTTPLRRVPKKVALPAAFAKGSSSSGTSEFQASSPTTPSRITKLNIPRSFTESPTTPASPTLSVTSSSASHRNNNNNNINDNDAENDTNNGPIVTHTASSSKKEPPVAPDAEVTTTTAEEKVDYNNNNNNNNGGEKTKPSVAAAAASMPAANSSAVSVATQPPAFVVSVAAAAAPTTAAVAAVTAPISPAAKSAAVSVATQPPAFVVSVAAAAAPTTAAVETKTIKTSSPRTVKTGKLKIPGAFAAAAAPKPTTPSPLSPARRAGSWKPVTTPNNKLQKNHEECSETKNDSATEHNHTAPVAPKCMPAQLPFTTTTTDTTDIDTNTTQQLSLSSTASDRAKATVDALNSTMKMTAPSPSSSMALLNTPTTTTMTTTVASSDNTKTTAADTTTTTTATATTTTTPLSSPQQPPPVRRVARLNKVQIPSAFTGAAASFVPATLVANTKQPLYSAVNNKKAVKPPVLNRLTPPVTTTPATLASCSSADDEGDEPSPTTAATATATIITAGWNVNATGGPYLPGRVSLVEVVAIDSDNDNSNDNDNDDVHPNKPSLDQDHRDDQKEEEDETKEKEDDQKEDHRDDQEEEDERSKENDALSSSSSTDAAAELPSNTCMAKSEHTIRMGSTTATNTAQPPSSEAADEAAGAMDRVSPILNDNKDGTSTPQQPDQTAAGDTFVDVTFEESFTEQTVPSVVYDCESSCTVEEQTLTDHQPSVDLFYSTREFDEIEEEEVVQQQQQQHVVIEEETIESSEEEEEDEPPSLSSCHAPNVATTTTSNSTKELEMVPSLDESANTAAAAVVEQPAETLNTKVVEGKDEPANQHDGSTVTTAIANDDEDGEAVNKPIEDHPATTTTTTMEPETANETCVVATLNNQAPLTAENKEDEFESMDDAAAAAAACNDIINSEQASTELEGKGSEDDDDTLEPVAKQLNPEAGVDQSEPQSDSPINVQTSTSVECLSDDNADSLNEKSTDHQPVLRGWSKDNDDKLVIPSGDDVQEKEGYLDLESNVEEADALLPENEPSAVLEKSPASAADDDDVNRPDPACDDSIAAIVLSPTTTSNSTTTTPQNHPDAQQKEEQSKPPLPEVKKSLNSKKSKTSKHGIPEPNAAGCACVIM